MFRKLEYNKNLAVEGALTLRIVLDNNMIFEVSGTSIENASCVSDDNSSEAHDWHVSSH